MGRQKEDATITQLLFRSVACAMSIFLHSSCCQAGAATFMTSFNDNDGVPSTGNTFILKDVLRGEWGFDGVVVSDWASVAE